MDLVDSGALSDFNTSQLGWIRHTPGPEPGTLCSRYPEFDSRLGSLRQQKDEQLRENSLMKQAHVKKLRMKEAARSGQGRQGLNASVQLSVAERPVPDLANRTTSAGSSFAKNATSLGHSGHAVNWMGQSIHSVENWSSSRRRKQTSALWDGVSGPSRAGKIAPTDGSRQMKGDNFTKATPNPQAKVDR